MHCERRAGRLLDSFALLPFWPALDQRYLLYTSGQLNPSKATQRKLTCAIDHHWPIVVLILDWQVAVSLRVSVYTVSLGHWPGTRSYSVVIEVSQRSIAWYPDNTYLV